MIFPGDLPADARLTLAGRRDWIPPMAFSGLFMLGYIVTLPMLIAQWVGILGLRHAGKNGAWWSMAAGVASGTIGVVAAVAGLVLMTTYRGSGGGPNIGNVAMIAGSTLPALGNILFAIGFAMHGLQAARAANRMQELEQLAAAMSEEITQLRQGGPAA
jgi:hypothetical protein